ncbi:serine/threonine protein kinase [Limnoglobus roseus]|uniref:non-specific serine/threonine protein kinase n=1 Tax=Limnoglobus roseus TaxID=2598579 RepID=A0A5C1ADR8_9BACT|nr:serine/threonine-protein kinase [Limnoglobus roseus]QEL15264.1 serine/threonine protein kinase [Limnoglobus roseus]
MPDERLTDGTQAYQDANAEPAETVPHTATHQPDGTQIYRSSDTLPPTATHHPDSTQAYQSEAPLPLPKSLPTVPGYEIVKELGRGGMGVVYLARQAALKRLVALKMIRGAGEASADQLERFHTEAEAVARLQHPNIVQIFEVGEYERNPYFALEFVDGPSMAAALTDREWSPAESAEFVETLARAVHHAHQKNIVHRDLKPANVLMMADGTPKVTDFGLAKRIEESASGQTHTGAVMGTPSYMAPEQAAGHIHLIGPATDTYALGAILYQCLTSKAPFRGDSILDTLEQVRTLDPVLPSKARPGVPRDLETVCLKALAKDPAARYPSALAMAEDLDRFRRGEPILGRREPFARAVLRKARRHAIKLVVAAAVVVVAVTVVGAVALSRSNRERRDLEGRVAAGLEQSPWTPAAADAVEGDIAQLAAVDEARGRAAAQKLVERYAASVKDELNQPRIRAEDRAGLEAKVAWLTPRDAKLAQGLQADLQARLRAWQVRREVTVAAADGAFENPVRPDGDHLTAAGPFVITNLPAEGTVRVTAEFDGQWWEGRRAGVVIGHRSNDRNDDANGYAFVVRPAAAATDPDARTPAASPPSFAAAQGHAAVEILRDGIPLTTAPLTLQPGRLQVVAERDGDRLRVSVNSGAATTFEDPVQLDVSARCRLAVVWPPNAGLRFLRVEDQPLPPVASVLERADDALARGQTADALALYAAFARDNPDADATAEARCKVGLCLVRLNRPEDASRAFERAFTDKSPRWGIISVFQIWLLHLKAKRFDDADAALAAIKLKYQPDEIRRYVPTALREEITYQFFVSPASHFFRDPKVVEQLDALFRLRETLQLDAGDPNRFLTLVIAYALADDFKKAKAFGDEHLDEMLEWGHAAGGSERPHWIMRWHAWVNRLEKRPDENVYAKHFYGPLRDRETAEDRKRSFLSMTLEAARDRAAAGKLDQAEYEVNRYLAEYPRPILDYSFYYEAYFLKGLLRQSAGDAAGASAEWRKGMYSEFLAQLPPADRAKAPPSPVDPKGLVAHWAMASWTDALSDAEAMTIFKSLSASFSTDEMSKQVAGALNMTPAVVRSTWLSPRGRDTARKMAFLDMTPGEFFWAPPRTLVYEKARQDLFAGRPTAEQDAILWDAIARATESFRVGGMTKTQVFQLALAWKGTMNVFGWGGIAPTMKPEIRGPVAFVLGHRYRSLNKPADAATLFRTAAADAPADSPLKRQAEAELKAK